MRAAEAMRRRETRTSPASPMPASKIIGSGPAQNSPVCTVVTLGTGGAAACVTGAAIVVAAGASSAEVRELARSRRMPPLMPVRRLRSTLPAWADPEPCPEVAEPPPI